MCTGCDTSDRFAHLYLQVSLFAVDMTEYVGFAKGVDEGGGAGARGACRVTECTMSLTL
jgi:hypothetical protein